MSRIFTSDTKLAPNFQYKGKKLCMNETLHRCSFILFLQTLCRPEDLDLQIKLT